MSQKPVAGSATGLHDADHMSSCIFHHTTMLFAGKLNWLDDCTVNEKFVQ